MAVIGRGPFCPFLCFLCGILSSNPVYCLYFIALVARWSIGPLPSCFSARYSRSYTSSFSDLSISINPFGAWTETRTNLRKAQNASKTENAKTMQELHTFTFLWDQSSHPAKILFMLLHSLGRACWCAGLDAPLIFSKSNAKTVDTPVQIKTDIVTSTLWQK